MTTKTLCPVPAPPPILRGSLPGGVKVQVDAWTFAEANPGAMCADVEYLGSIDELLAAGVLTADMLQARASYVRGDARGMHDRRGTNFHLHRAGTKSAPDRWRVRLRANPPERILDFPGVRELAPAGFAAPRGRPALRLVVDNTREARP